MFSADGNFEVTLATKATIYSEGLVEWKPPAIYKSSCEIDVEYFPFDEQTCVLKFGSWTYDGFKVGLFFNHTSNRLLPSSSPIPHRQLQHVYFTQNCLLFIFIYTFKNFYITLHHFSTFAVNFVFS